MILLAWLACAWACALASPIESSLHSLTADSKEAVASLNQLRGVLSLTGTRQLELIARIVTSAISKPAEIL